MNWAKLSKPKEGISYYDHTICESPIGIFKIEWKSWKENDSYDVMLDDSIWVGSEYSLEKAKEITREYLVKKYTELAKFLYY